MKLNPMILSLFVFHAGMLGAASATPAQEPGPSNGKFTVRVQTAGLVALVPDASGHALTILLVDARERMTAKNGCTIPIHQPQLVWKAGSCSCTGFPDDPCTLSSTVLGPDVKTWDVRIEAQGAAAAATKVLDLGGLLDQRPGDPAPPRHRPNDPPPRGWGAEWSLLLTEIQPEAEATQVRKKCFAEVPGDDCPVAARLALDHGKLQTCRLGEIEVGKDPDGHPVNLTYTFGAYSLNGQGKVKTYTSRALPAVWEVAWEQAGTGIKVVMAPAGKPQEARSVTLRPKAGEVVLDFMNLPQDEDLSSCDCDPTKIDYHFEQLYRLAVSKPSSVVVPVREAIVTDVQPQCGLVELSKALPSGVVEGSKEKDKKDKLALPPHISACIPTVFSREGDHVGPPATGVEN